MKNFLIVLFCLATFETWNDELSFAFADLIRKRSKPGFMAEFPEPTTLNDRLTEAEREMGEPRPRPGPRPRPQAPRPPTPPPPRPRRPNPTPKPIRPPGSKKFFGLQRNNINKYL